MTRASRPARAMRDGAALLIVAIAFRTPAIERQFAAALRAATAPTGALVATQTEAGESPPPAPAALAAIDDRAEAAVRALHGHPASGVRLAMQTMPVARPVETAPLPADGTAPHATPEPVTALTAAPAPAIVASTATGDAGTLATAAYARLAEGDRREAARLFDAALTGDDPRATVWRRQRDALVRRWSGNAYSIVRGGGAVAFGAEPVLGGGQSGGGIAFTPDPLSARPVALTLRGSAAHDDGGRSGFAAVGVQWHPLPGVTVAAERLIPVGPAASGAWTARLAAGGDRRYGPVRLSAYGEGGVIGAATYAAVQGRAAAVAQTHGVEIGPGIGLWSSVQHGRGTTIDRIDAGPGIVARRGVLSAEVDYRWRVAGNAAPGSGPVLTVSAAF